MPDLAHRPVLVLSRRDDLTADLVIHELDQRSAPVVRIDPADFPLRQTLSGRIDSGLWRGPLTTADGVDVDLAAVRSVYYRRPGLPSLPSEMSAAEQEWAMREAVHGVYGTLGALDCVFLNHPARNQAAEMKAAQLAAAARCGLTVPPTLVTNDPDEARRFAKEHRAVIKPLRGGALDERGERKAAFANIIDPDDIDESLRLTAHLLQAWVEKTHEVRLVVVGERMFAAGIWAGSAESRTDFRTDYASLTYRAVDVPIDVAAGVRALMSRLDLVFAAIDFAVDADGRWVFPGDVNPNGQWAWLEGHLPSLRITAAIADVLERGCA